MTSPDAVPVPVTSPELSQGAIVDLRRSSQPPRARSKRSLTPWILAGLAIFGPTALVGGYVFGWATPRFTASTSVAVRSLAQTPATGPGLNLGAAGLTMGGGDQDAALVAAYINGAEALTQLDKEIQIRSHWSDNRRDWWFRLRADASIEEALVHARDRITVVNHPESGLVKISVQAYDPTYAKVAVQALVRLGEQAVNDLGHVVTRDRLAAFESEVSKAESAMRHAGQQLLAFRSNSQTPDARIQAEAEGSLIADVDAGLGRERAALAGLLAVTGDNADAVVSARARIAALETQRSQLVARILGQAGSGALALRQGELEMDVQMRTQAFQAALTAREQARIELSGKLKRLVMVDPPYVPEAASQPRSWYLTLTTLVIATLFYGVLALLWATIREHRD